MRVSDGNHLRLRKPSLREKVARLLREDGGAWTVAEVADWLGVKPAPIRIALWNLRCDGLVELDSDGREVRYRWKGGPVGSEGAGGA